jgi:HSP20 family molecular chaperone IbpA
MASHGTTTVAGDHDSFLELPHKLDQTGRTAFLLDAYEADNVIELTAEVPGVQESDIDVSLEGDILTISVEKHGQPEGKRMHFSERAYGRFQRSIQLPFVPDAESVKADVQNGLLVIRFPRVQSERTRRIAIGGTRAEGQERSAIGSKWSEQPKGEKPLTLTDEVRKGSPAPDLTSVPRPKAPSAT